MDWNDIDAQSNDFYLHGASRKVGNCSGFEWFVPPGKSLGDSINLEYARLLLSIYGRIGINENDNESELLLPKAAWAKIKEDNRVNKESQLVSLGLYKNSNNPFNIIHKVEKSMYLI